MINTNIIISLDVWNLDKSSIYYALLHKLNIIESNCRFILNKYTIDGKLPYSKSSEKIELVRDTRDTLARVLLEQRKALKNAEELD